MNELNFGLKMDEVLIFRGVCIFAVLLLQLLNGAFGQEPADGALRLVPIPRKGRLEVYHSAEWGTVCDNEWGLPESNVACRQLGYKRADGFSAGAANGMGSGQVWLDTVECKGNENRLDECSFGGWASGKCNHDQDVSVSCTYYAEASTDNAVLTSRFRTAAIVFGVLSIVCSLVRCCFKCCTCDEEEEHAGDTPVCVNVTALDEDEHDEEPPNDPESNDAEQAPPSYDDIDNYPESKEDIESSEDTRL